MNKEELLKAMNFVKVFVSNKKVDGSNLISFVKDHIYSFNGEVGIIKKFDSNINCSIDGITLLTLISKMNEDEVFLRVSKNRLGVISGNCKASLSVLDRSLVKELKYFEKQKKWKEIPVNFVEGIRATLFSSLKESSKGILSCLCFKDNLVTSCDNSQLSRFRFEGEISSFLLSNSESEKLCKYELTHYINNKDWVLFKGEDFFIFCRKIIGSYPDFEKFFNPDGIDIELPEGYKESLSRVGIIIGNGGDTNDGILYDNKLFVQSTGKEIIFIGENMTGEVKETLAYESKEKFSFSVKYKDFLSLVKRTNKFNMCNGRLVYSSDNYDHVVCLLKD